MCVRDVLQHLSNNSFPLREKDKATLCCETTTEVLVLNSACTRLLDGSGGGRDIRESSYPRTATEATEGPCGTRAFRMSAADLVE